jgi:hypothetical protein
MHNGDAMNDATDGKDAISNPNRLTKRTRIGKLSPEYSDQNSHMFALHDASEVDELVKCIWMAHSKLARLVAELHPGEDGTPMRGALDCAADAPDAGSRIHSLALDLAGCKTGGLQDRCDEFWPLRVVLGGNGKPCRLVVVPKAATVVAGSTAPALLTTAQTPDRDSTPIHTDTGTTTPMEEQSLGANGNVGSDGKTKHRNRKPSWAIVAMPYMKTLFAAGKYKSAAVFYRALIHRVEEPDSPFELVNRELFCTEAGTTVSEGSLGNAWPEIRAQ